MTKLTILLLIGTFRWSDEKADQSSYTYTYILEDFYFAILNNKMEMFNLNHFSILSSYSTWKEFLFDMRHGYIQNKKKILQNALYQFRIKPNCFGVDHNILKWQLWRHLFTQISNLIQNVTLNHILNIFFFFQIIDNIKRCLDCDLKIFASHST